jgi:hypothetical protein
MVKKFKDLLSLKHFMQRSQVKNLYRQLLREARYCQDESLRKDIQQHICEGFRRNQHVQEAAVIRSLVKDGLSQVQKIKDLCDASQKRYVDVKDRKSWLEEEDPYEKRGRVGVGWPWESMGQQSPEKPASIEAEEKKRS